MRAVICCAGDGKRWNDHLGGPKQLVISIDGENILRRTVRLLREHGVTDIVIAAPRQDPDRYAVPGARVEPIDPVVTGTSMDKFLATEHLWGKGRTTLLWGDVYYTEQAIETIVSHRGRGQHYFRRPGPSEITGHPRDESWAVTFTATVKGTVLAGAREVARAVKSRQVRVCHIRAHYAQHLGLPPERWADDLDAVRDTPGQTIIDDWTDDFDRPCELHRWVLTRARAAPVEGGVSVVVPWRDADEHRMAAWEWVAERWAETGYEVVIASDERTGLFNRSAAVMHGMAKATGDVIVVADADTWMPRVADAVDAIRAGARWVVPHDRFVRFTEDATKQILTGTDPHTLDSPQNHDERPYRQLAGSHGVYTRDAVLEVPMDQRFEGWGGEENAWGWALSTLIGPPVRLDGPVWHLWHPPQPRETRKRGNRPNEQLRQRYRRANGNPAVMAALVAAQGERTPRRPGWVVVRHTDGRSRRLREGSASARRLAASDDWEVVA